MTQGLRKHLNRPIFRIRIYEFSLHLLHFHNGQSTSKHLANLFNYFVSEVVGTIHRQWPGEQEQL